MTIRRNANIAAANSDYSAFLTGVEAAPAGVLVQAQTIADLIGDMVVGLIRRAREEGLNVCNGDAIREIEAMTFTMLWDKNPNSEINTAVGLGRTLENYPESADRVLAGLRRDSDFINEFRAHSNAPVAGIDYIGFDAILQHGWGFGQ